MNFKTFDIRDIVDHSSKILDSFGRPKVMSADFYRGLSANERMLIGSRTAMYGLPTTELIDCLRSIIGDRKAIEIGAGHGTISRALGITGTDNMMQSWPHIAAQYSAMKQKVIEYGDDIENISANDAVLKYKPQVVIASWVTHLYLPERHEAEGNENGVNEEHIIENCDTYVFIGNSEVHKKKSIWSIPHERFEPNWLFSRSFNGSPEFIAIWNKKQ